jgi:hypothetical protein
VISVDDSEEKMVFLVKAYDGNSQKPRLVSYLTSIAKTFNKVF